MFSSKTPYEEEVRMQSVLDIEITKKKSNPIVPYTNYKLSMILSKLECNRLLVKLRDFNEKIDKLGNIN